MANPAKNTICIWYDRDAEDAARFYAKTFPDSSVGAVHRAPGDFPSGKKGDILTVEFKRDGRPVPRPQRRTRVQAQRSIFRFRSQPRIKLKPIATGVRLSATAARRARAAGAKTNGDCPGRSRRSS